MTPINDIAIPYIKLTSTGRYFDMTVFAALLLINFGSCCKV